MDRRLLLSFQASAAAGGVLCPLRFTWGQSTVSGISRLGKPVSLTASDFKDLRASLQGKLLLAQDEGYDAARRYWDSAFDRRPALIVLAANPDNIVRAVSSRAATTC